MNQAIDNKFWFALVSRCCTHYGVFNVKEEQPTGLLVNTPMLLPKGQIQRRHHLDSMATGESVKR